MSTGITGVILAGGKNSRMGTDKGLLPLHGKLIIERIINALKPLVDELIIISNGNNYDYLGYRVINDLIKDCGPMGGIYTALSVSHTEKNLVISCDMPLITKDMLELIISHANGYEIVIPLNGEKLEPLCAIYDTSCKDKMQKLLEKKEWKMQDALNHFNVKKVAISDSSSGIDHFMNINTPEEYNKVKAIKHEYSS